MGLRIIAGSKRGMTLKAPAGLETRPTLGRIRESLFMILMPVLPGARVMDVFAGSGALGLEALSRGAAQCTFIENAPAALTSLRANLERFGAGQRAEVRTGDALAQLRRGPRAAEGVDLILIDPPYGLGLAEQSMQIIGGAADRWLAPGGQVVVQLAVRDALEEAYGPLRATREERYSETRIVFFRRGDGAG